MITIVRRNMKRASVFQWILATALFTVSCTTDVWNETEDDANAICFQAPQTESRAAVEGSSLPANSSFLVWGGYDDNVKNVFDGETVSESNGVWNYEGGTRYWIPGKTYRFYGVYPATLSTDKVNVGTDGTITITDFDCSATGENAVDLMTAGSGVMSGTNPSSVTMSFKHLLARVTFVGKIASGTVGIEGFNPIIQSAKLYGMSKYGSYSSSTSSWQAGVASTKDEPFASVTKKKPSVTGESIIEVLPFPQAIAGNYFFEVTYSKSENGETTTQNASLLSLPVLEWKAGYSYQYSFSISVDDRIIFDTPTVTEWDEAVGGIIIVD